MIPRIFIILAGLLIFVGIWTWFGPIGQSPAQVGLSYGFLVGLGAGAVGVVMLIVALAVVVTTQ